MLLETISYRPLAPVVAKRISSNERDEDATLSCGNWTNAATGLFGRIPALGTAESVLGRRLLDVEFALIDLRAVLGDLLGEDGTLDPHRRDVDAEHVDDVVAIHLE